MPRTVIAGNWKMNGLRASLQEIRAIAEGVTQGKEGVEAMLCVPATLLAAAAEAAKGTGLLIGGETCHGRESGAHTGDISAAMLADAGATHVIVGHSERRADHGETNSMVAGQARAALTAGLTPIICVGETQSQRETGLAVETVTRMIQRSLPDGIDPAGIIIAYEPVWAIGTGNVATTKQVDEMHTLLRGQLRERFGDAADAIPILYGGSVNAGNIAGLLAVPDVNGGLIGGASLKAADFLAIYAQA